LFAEAFAGGCRADPIEEDMSARLSVSTGGPKEFLGARECRTGFFDIPMGGRRSKGFPSLRGENVGRGESLELP